MKKLIHQFRVYGTDDSRVTDFTRWRQHGGAKATRAEAWLLAKRAKLESGYRFVRIVESRVY